MECLTTHFLWKALRSISDLKNMVFFFFPKSPVFLIYILSQLPGKYLNKPPWKWTYCSVKCNRPFLQPPITSSNKMGCTGPSCFTTLYSMPEHSLPTRQRFSASLLLNGTSRGHSAQKSSHAAIVFSGSSTCSWFYLKKFSFVHLLDT